MVESREHTLENCCHVKILIGLKLVCKGSGEDYSYI